MAKRYDNRKKKRIKRYSQKNYQKGLWQKHYRDDLTKSMKDKEKKDRKKTGDDGKIPQDKET